MSDLPTAPDGVELLLLGDSALRYVKKLNISLYEIMQSFFNRAKTSSLNILHSIACFLYSGVGIHAIGDMTPDSSKYLR